MSAQIYCLMRTNGKPLTDKVRDILLINACEMAETGKEKQKIKGRDYEGLITSDLETTNYVGMSIIVFNADIACPDIGVSKVQYGVRTSDLDEGILASGQWDQVPRLKSKHHELN